MCCLAHRELAWLFLEPDTGLDHCPRILLSCFRARASVTNPLLPKTRNNPLLLLLLLRWGVVSENKSEKGCWTSVRSALSITVPFCQRGKVVSFTRIGPFLPAAAKLFRRYSNCWFLVLVLVLIQRVSEGHGDALET